MPDTLFLVGASRLGITMDVWWLGEAAAHDSQAVGGKAARLSQLAARETVPAGFVIPALALASALTTDVVGPTVPTAALVTQVAESYARLAGASGARQPRVAVRSSALDEDGHDASFAGQHQTFLNVIGADQISAAIVHCWESGRSAEVLAYRRRQGLGDEAVRLAVLVQLMAPADVSAVVFSANPISGRRDEIIVTASWGLGESIVGGTVTPDTFTVGKQGMVLRESRIADKARMTVAGASGTREVDVPRFLRGQPSLTADQAIDMAALAMRLETAMGWPVDVECAYAGGQLFLLQCRPITTLASFAR